MSGYSDNHGHYDHHGHGDRLDLAELTWAVQEADRAVTAAQEGNLANTLWAANRALDVFLDAAEGTKWEYALQNIDLGLDKIADDHTRAGLHKIEHGLEKLVHLAQGTPFEHAVELEYYGFEKVVYSGHEEKGFDLLHQGLDEAEQVLQSFGQRHDGGHHDYMM
jgi:hypothetical protein